MSASDPEAIDHDDYVHMRRTSVEALVKLVDDRWTSAEEVLKRIKACLKSALRDDVLEFDTRVARRMAELNDSRDSAG